MTVDTILNELQVLGQEQTKKILLKHGASEPLYGVKVEDLKKIAKKTGKNYELSMALYRSGNSDAMYLAGIISDPTRMHRDDLNAWAAGAYWYMLSEYAVAWTAAEHPEGFEAALEWIDSEHEAALVAGWATLSAIATTRPDELLQLKVYEALLDRVKAQIHQVPGRLKFTMNNFIISVGSYVQPLHHLAINTAESIGKIAYKLNGTACKVPDAKYQIEQSTHRNPSFKKKKTSRC